MASGELDAWFVGLGPEGLREALGDLSEENRRLRRELADARRVIVRAHLVLAESVMLRVQVQPKPRKGRPHGKTLRDREEFLDKIYAIYSSLSPEERSRDEVARQFKISRRTLYRYMARWAVPWPPEPPANSTSLNGSHVNPMLEIDP